MVACASILAIVFQEIFNHLCLTWMLRENPSVKNFVNKIYVYIYTEV